ncbi:MAG: hypothetical protein FIA99_16635 [Ruminiclostridium sp.]|nr:hypothetical protein [Ruminiclostridium sp.]
MLQNFRCKNAKDIELATETLISNSCFKNVLHETGRTIPKLTITYQQNNTETYDSYIDQKK